MPLTFINLEINYNIKFLKYTKIYIYFFFEILMSVFTFVNLEINYNIKFFEIHKNNFFFFNFNVGILLRML